MIRMKKLYVVKYWLFVMKRKWKWSCVMTAEKVDIMDNKSI